MLVKGKYKKKLYWYMTSFKMVRKLKVVKSLKIIILKSNEKSRRKSVFDICCLIIFNKDIEVSSL